MSRMTIEKQKEYIKDERKIIDNILKYKPVKDYNKLYIQNLEEKIKQRENWILEQQKNIE